MKKITVVRNFVTIALLLAFMVVLPAARADETNQETKVTFSGAVQISGHVLPAGTYWFVVPAEFNQHDVVRIYGSDRTTLYATVLTINAERSEPTDNTAIKLAERESMQPPTIMTWFYPGRTIGHEFLYPKQVREELAKDKQTTVVAGS
jgi:hypothetical protein